MKKFFKAITFRGYYEWLPTVIFFWYSFFFLTLVQIYGSFAIVDNWFIVNFSRPGFALFNFNEGLFDKISLHYMGLRSFFYATTLRPFLVASFLAVLCVFLLNLITLWLFRKAKAKSVPR